MPPTNCLQQAACALVVLLLAVGASAATPHSKLWGEGGELFKLTEKGRLQDWSWAGYKGGMELPPTADTLKATVDITQFGAIPDSTFDNTQAIQAAIASQACQAAAQCVVYIPPGLWTLQKQMIIKAPVIMRGAGRDRTTLYFPFSLKEIKRDLTHNPWFSDRLLTFSGSSNITYEGPGATKLVNITKLSKRGSSRVYVDSTAAFRKGQQVRIVASDHGKDGKPISPKATPLLHYLYGDMAMKVDTKGFGNRRNLVDILARVKEVLPDSIVLDRALPVSVSPAWKDASVHVFQATGAEGPVMGLEGVTVDYVRTQYRGHFREDGYAGVGFSSTSNCFARNLRIKNSDWGLEAYRTHRCTFSDLIVDSDRPTDKQGHYGHHAIGVTRAYDNLVTDFVIAAPYVHDLSVAAGANGNVFRNARAADMNLDFHRQAPYSNLFTNIHAGEGNRPWESGGRAGRGPHAAAWNTVWGFITDKGQRLPQPCARGNDKKKHGCGAFGPLMNVVGANVQGKAPDGWWIEDIPAGQLVPQDLYTAQVKARLGRVLYTAPMPTIPKGLRRAGIRPPTAATAAAAASQAGAAPNQALWTLQRNFRRQGGQGMASVLDIMLEEFDLSETEMEALTDMLD